MRGFTLGGTFAYTDARFTQDIPLLAYHSGDPLPQTPRYSGSLTADFSQPLAGDWTAHLGGGVRMESSRESNNFQGTVFREPGYGALDLNADVSNGRYTLRVFAKNVTDERAFDSISGVRNALTGEFAKVSGVIIQPRTVGLAVDAKF